MNPIHFTLRLIKSINDISKFINVNSTYHREAKATIDKLTSSYDLESAEAIPLNFKLKLQWYMAECLYSCEKLNSLTDQTSNYKQRQSYLLSGALGAICDFIIDDIEMENEQIKTFKKPETEEKYDNIVDKLYALFYHSFFNSLEESIKARAIQYYELLFDVQVRSKQQFNQNITQQEVDEICKAKCGYSILFLRSLVNGEITEVEKKACYELGGFIQYCNDAQDLHKDLKKGLRTFASTRPNLETIANDIDKQKTIAYSLVKETPYQQKKIDDLLFSLHMMGIGIIAKLYRYHEICNNAYSHENLTMKNKEEIRPQLAIRKLIPYCFPRVIKYNFDTVHKPYNFNLNLKP
ncbi:hypothetical protein [Marivirga sp.]|uniref:hypothetical protein n=1 Tax=Marivirga sp. TaxID=2018662 RepID=UPI002D7EC3ED|nr:hypothetical protein [Marivirga sp.]HET8859440.1 hypothetical protein [Marivirga sp.]